MLTTIQELEREIDRFHNNIKDSNELIEILTSLVSVTKTQTESFEENIKALQNTLGNLPSELSDVFQKKTEDFLQEVRNEYQSYQTAVTQLMNGYDERFSRAESVIEGMPSALEAQMKKDRTENIAGLKQIQKQYATDLEKMNEDFSKQLQAAFESIQAVPGQIKDISVQQYSTFLKELENMTDARLTQISETEKRVVDLSHQLELKYNDFVARLEATNMDQLYKFCHDMNKSINTKLSIALGGVAAAVIISIISLFI